MKNCMAIVQKINLTINPMNKSSAYKYILCLILSLTLCLAFCACGGDEASESGGASGSAGAPSSAGSHVAGGAEANYGVKAKVENDLDDPEAEDLFISAVKNAVPEDYPDITIGEAYDNYFSDPEWRAFESEGASDGGIEYVVEFTGGCIYEDAEAEALIQFTFDPELEGFQATFFSLDGKPMDFRDLNAVSEIAYYQLSGEA